MAISFERAGPLAFPITPLHPDLSVDLDAFGSHISWMVDHDAPALFVACGTGEFASMSVEEMSDLARVAVDASRSADVFLGAGGPLSNAVACARMAEKAGAAGLLLFPPYLREFEPDGLVAYVRAVAEATTLDLILYQRDGTAYEPPLLERLVDLPNVNGLKDGLGDVERMQRTVHEIGDRLTYFNGMPTAETYQPSYAAAGVPFYSSAVFNFVPEISWAFWRAQSTGDAAATHGLLAEFFVPLAELRRKTRGYAIALVKAGVEVRRGLASTIRPPLTAVSPPHVMALEALIDKGLARLNALEDRTAAIT